MEWLGPLWRARERVHEEHCRLLFPRAPICPPRWGNRSDKLTSLPGSVYVGNIATDIHDRIKAMEGETSGKSTLQKGKSQ